MEILRVMYCVHEMLMLTFDQYPLKERKRIYTEMLRRGESKSNRHRGITDSARPLLSQRDAFDRSRNICRFCRARQEKRHRSPRNQPLLTHERRRPKTQTLSPTATGYSVVRLRSALDRA